MPGNESSNDNQSHTQDDSFLGGKLESVDLSDQQTHFEFMLDNYGVSKTEYTEYLLDPDSSDKRDLIDVAYHQSNKFAGDW